MAHPSTPPTPVDGGVAGLSHPPPRTLAAIALLCGVSALVAGFVIPTALMSQLREPALRVLGLSPPFLIAAGFVVSLAARRCGERGRLATTALSLNTLLLIVYSVLLGALFLNPVTPS